MKIKIKFNIKFKFQIWWNESRIRKKRRREKRRNKKKEIKIDEISNILKMNLNNNESFK